MRLCLTSPLCVAAAVLLVAPTLAQTTPGSGDLSQLAARISAQIQQVRMVTSQLPRVNVTHVQFGTGCPNAADPSGQQDSTCAIRNAIQFAQANAIRGAGYPVLYFPHGRYKVAGSGLAPAFNLTAAIGMEGDGAQSTTIFNASPTAGTVSYNSASECSAKPGPCFIRIEGLTFAGDGHRSMGGLIQINNTPTGLMTNVVLAETGGIALNLQGSSERWSFSQMEIDHARWSVLTEGDTNENYFERVNVIDPGADLSGFCFSVNCPGGHLITTGTWLPDPHSAVFLDGDNVHWMNSSIKSTAIMGGIRLAAVTSSVSHTYFEGFAWGDQPRTNHAIELGGKLEIGHLTRGISASELVFPVDDAGWQPLYANDPAEVNTLGEHAYTPIFAIFPADYVYGSKEPSAAVPGITRGTYEAIKVAGFAGDGNAHLRTRALNKTSAVAWPAGSTIEQIPANGYGIVRVEENHLNSIEPNPKRYTSGCDDNAQLSHWTSSPSRLCAEIIVGLVPDGYMVPYPDQHVSGDFQMAVVNNSIANGGSEVDGQGWIKIAANGTVDIDQGNAPLTRFSPAETALNDYQNGNTRVHILQWGKQSALAMVRDLSANAIISPQNHLFSSDVSVNHSLSHQYLGEQCWYPIQPGTAQPTNRFCVRAGGPSQETLVNGRWVAATR